MKKLIAIVTLFSLLLCLAACGSGKDNDGTTTPTQPSPTEPDIDPTVTALVINDYQLTGVELNYFFKDMVTQWVNTYGSYAAYFGLDVSAALDEQTFDKESGETWADYFMDMAVEQAKNVYAMYDAALKADYQLSEAEQAEVDSMYKSMEEYAKNQKFDSVDAYLKDLYGQHSSLESYKSFCDKTILASYYYSHYSQTLLDGYTDEDLLNYVGDKAYQYNSYTYTSVYLPVDNFKIGGTKDADGKVTYSDEEVKAAEAYLANVVEDLTSGDINTTVKLNVALALMEDELAAAKGESTPTTHTTATENTNVLYTKVNEVMQEWLRDESRTAGDITAIPYHTTSKDEAGTEIKTLKGYYVLIFQSVTDNDFALANVRHILAAFEGGTTDKTTGQTIYSETEKAQAKAKAEQLLEQWTTGDATEDSFAQLANKHSADGDGTTGGLYEDVYPGQMVTNFNDWCFDQRRQPGDSGIVESPYGYHVMYYVGDSEQTYRDYMVSNEKLTADLNDWQEQLGKDVTAELKDTSAVDTGYTIAAS